MAADDEVSHVAAEHFDQRIARKQHLKGSAPDALEADGVERRGLVLKRKPAWKIRLAAAEKRLAFAALVIPLTRQRNVQGEQRGGHHREHRTDLDGARPLTAQRCRDEQRRNQQDVRRLREEPDAQQDRRHHVGSR
jgi:hypothetical protein